MRTTPQSEVEPRFDVIYLSDDAAGGAAPSGVSDVSISSICRDAASFAVALTLGGAAASGFQEIATRKISEHNELETFLNAAFSSDVNIVVIFVSSFIVILSFIH